MKVLHIISDYSIGGAGRYLLTLLSEDIWGHCRVMVACPSGGALCNALGAIGIDTIPLPDPDRSFSPVQIAAMLSHLTTAKYDIIHTHASVSGRLAGRLSPGHNLIMTKHGIGLSQPPSGFARMVSAVAQQMLSDGFIAVSNAVKQRLLREGVPEKRIKVIYNGVNAASLQERVKAFRNNVEAFRRNNDGSFIGASPVIACIGRLSREKGHINLIRCVPVLAKRFENISLIIAGDGPMKSILDKEAKHLGVEKHVHFLGFQDDISAVLAMTDVFIMPSLSEGLGLALLEAMAVGLPVVASDTGGIPEVISNGIDGLLVPIGDTGKLTDSITHILTNHELSRRLGESAKSKVRAKFSSEAMASQTLRYYQTVLGE